MRNALLHGDITDRVIESFFSVFNILKSGHLESVYEKALIKVLRMRGLHCVAQVPLDVWFLGEVIGQFRVDILVEDVVVVELKACTRLIPQHEAQLISYLTATRKQVGLLLNFGPAPTFKRIYRRAE